jgi:AraC family transcriptional regulator, arabinose operon regulatory protein
MSSSIVIVGENELPRPGRDTTCCPGLLSAYNELGRGHHVVRRRGTATSYLVYSVSGVGFFRDSQNRAIQIGPGDLALLQARNYQEYGISPTSRQWACHWVHFDAQPHWWPWIPLSKRIALQGLSLARMASTSARQQLSRLFFMLHDERQRPGLWGTASALNVLERILILARTNAEDGEALVADSRVSRVLQAIEAAGPPAPSLAELSRIAGISPSRLAHVFKEQTGISILAAVNRVRLSAAQLALQDSSATLQQVADRCGFTSPYSFSNWYLKQTGLRPGEYQRRWASRLEGARTKLASRK